MATATSNELSAATRAFEQARQRAIDMNHDDQHRELEVEIAARRAMIRDGAGADVASELAAFIAMRDSLPPVTEGDRQGVRQQLRSAQAEASRIAHRDHDKASESDWRRFHEGLRVAGAALGAIGDRLLQTDPRIAFADERLSHVRHLLTELLRFEELPRDVMLGKREREATAEYSREMAKAKAAAHARDLAAEPERNATAIEQDLRRGITALGTLKENYLAELRDVETQLRTDTSQPVQIRANQLRAAIPGLTKAIEQRQASLKEVEPIAKAQREKRARQNREHFERMNDARKLAGMKGMTL